MLHLNMIPPKQMILLHFAVFIVSGVLLLLPFIVMFSGTIFFFFF